MPVKVRAVGNRKHHLCDVIHDIYRKTFARAGLKGVLGALRAANDCQKTYRERLRCQSNRGSARAAKERDSVRNLIPNERESLNAVVRELV